MIGGGHFEIVSADSVQVYRLLDIGSGKPAPAQRESVVHHLVDIVDPDFPFTAGDYCRAAREAMLVIEERGKIPLFVGGTGLYIDAFFKGLAEIPRIDGLVKEGLSMEMEVRGLPALYEELGDIDAPFAARIHPNDRQRVLRGLEVFRGTGIPLSEWFKGTAGADSPEVLYIGLNPDRGLLYRRIDARVDRMMERGFLDEVKALRGRGYGPGLKSMKSIGYAELNSHLDGGPGFPETVEKIKLETRRYAKRQMTWFRKNREVRWFEEFDLAKIKSLIYSWLEIKI